MRRRHHPHPSRREIGRSGVDLHTGTWAVLVVSAFAVAACVRPETPPRGCDPIGSGGCAEPGHECKLDPAPRCVEVLDPSGAGEPCRPGRCAEGTICLTAVTATVARCHSVCALESGRGCAAPELCRLRVAEGPWGACATLPSPCDPLDGPDCPKGQSCAPWSAPGTFRCRPSVVEGEAVSAKTGSIAEGCAAMGCGDGLLCVQSREGARCRRPCRESADCPTPEQCVGELVGESFAVCLP